MNQNLPMFEDPAPQAEPTGPKKPRRKPVKRAKKAAPKVVKKPRRKVSKHPALGAPYNRESNHGGKFTPDVYAAIAALMALDIPARNLTMEVAKALTK